jgi:hypothetical protein
MDETQQKEAAFALLNQLMSNPETRRQTQLLVKKANPKASIPEIDAAQPLVGAINNQQKEIDALKMELMKRDAQADIDKKHGSLKSQGYTDEGIKNIEKLMVERNISDYDAGAALFDRMNPAPSVSSPSYVGQSFFNGVDTSGEDFKKFSTNPGAWVDDETSRAIADFRSGRAN